MRLCWIHSCARLAVLTAAVLAAVADAANLERRCVAICLELQWLKVSLKLQDVRIVNWGSMSPVQSYYVCSI